MNRVFTFIMTVVFIAASPDTRAAESPVKLAIIAETPEATTALNVLTVELSKRPELQLLEREQIQKVYREQALSAGNRDYLKLGQVLGADGLLLLEKTTEGTNQWLSVQLVAVKPGVLLSSERFAWPLSSLTQWAAGIATHLEPLLPKLGVLVKDAVPISVVNLRSPIQTSQSREIERQLTLLAIERLSREKQLFVLERRKMQLMNGEKDLNGLDDSAFWDGSYLLDGVIDRNGFTQDKITISARLSPPKGATPLQIEASGSRTNLAEVINQLTEGILKALTINEEPAPWNPADEADQFYAEAQWAYKWNLYPQAQAASESAWALGRRDSDTAQLLVRSYVESIPGKPHVQQVPDATAFPKLDRSLEYISLNPQTFFSGTNALGSFDLSVLLLRQAFCQLESYYYAAEMRPAHADDLLSLRSRVRQMFKVLDEQAAGMTNAMRWNDPRLPYSDLKWTEGGMAFERPEDAMDFYRNYLVAGARLETEPRIVGWTWPDRQRAPELSRRLVKDATSSTNAAVRLEGLFLTLIKTGDDEPGGWHIAEENLLSAMWENRAFIFEDAGLATLVERAEQVLKGRMGEYSISKPFTHEPFASYKHRIRMAFLKSSASTNVAVLENLFPNTNVRKETAEQARELLPLMEALSQNPALSKCTEPRLEILRSSAGVVEKTEPPPPLKAAPVLEARLVPWKLSPDQITADRTPGFNGMIFRNDHLWVRVRYLAPQDWNVSDTTPTSYVEVDPQLGVIAEIPFPDQYGYSGQLFEVSKSALFAEAGGLLYEYKFQEKNWTKIPAPMEGASTLVWQNGRLFVGRGEGLLEVNPESASVQVLVSARRAPPANQIDPLWSKDTRIFPLADGKLGALAAENYLVFDPAAEQWSIYPIAVTGTNTFYQFTADYFSPAGAMRLLTGSIPHRYLVGFWEDGELESLLMEETGFTMPVPAAEKLLPPLHWEWPRGYSLEHSQFVADGKTVWALMPNGISWWASNVERTRFSDKRDATLLCFKPDEPTPLMAAIRFPMEQLRHRPIVNDHPSDIFFPLNYGLNMDILPRLMRHVGNMAFWLRSPHGLVLGGPSYCGHWFISDDALEDAFASQRERPGKSTNSQASPPTTLLTQ